MAKQVSSKQEEARSQGTALASSGPPAAPSAAQAVREDAGDRRFDRMARLVGPASMARLWRSHVAVFGMGGVGGYAVEALARSGVGRLTLVDFDEVCITNFNRQIHAVQGAVGRSKVELMEARVRSIHPAIAVRAVREFYEQKTADRLLDPVPDMVVDCIDNVTAKMHLLATCIQRKIPVVTVLGASAKLDPTRIQIVPLPATYNDPLARAIRKHIRRRHRIADEDLAQVMAVFSDEPVILPDPGYKTLLCGVDCVCPNSRNPHHTCKRRHIIHGSAVFVTAAFGLAAASVVIRRLTGKMPVG